MVITLGLIIAWPFAAATAIVEAKNAETGETTEEVGETVEAETVEAETAEPEVAEEVVEAENESVVEEVVEASDADATEAADDEKEAA